MKSAKILPVSIAIIAVCAASSLAKEPKETKRKPASGETVYKQYCSKCHVEGSNIIKPHHPIAGSEKLSNIGVFKEYLEQPPGHMPYYEAVVKNEGTLKALYDYCKTLKPKPVKQTNAGHPAV